MEADAYYPVIPEADCVKAFPGAERTYVTLPEGRFTGGNMMLLNADVISGGVIKAKDIFARRKKPWELCGWLGFGFVLKFLLHRLTLSDIELRASELLGFSGKAVFRIIPRSVWMWIKKKTGSCWKNILRIASRKEGRYGFESNVWNV